MILRSSVAHGIIKSLDTTRARAMPGVRHVVAGADFGAVVPRIPLRLQPLPQLEAFPSARCSPTARFVMSANPIAVVLADTPGIAEDALDHIDLDIEPLPAITNREQAEAKAAVLFEDHGSNAAITW